MKKYLSGMLLSLLVLFFFAGCDELTLTIGDDVYKNLGYMESTVTYDSRSQWEEELLEPGQTYHYTISDVPTTRDLFIHWQDFYDYNIDDMTLTVPNADIEVRVFADGLLLMDYQDNGFHSNPLLSNSVGTDDNGIWVSGYESYTVVVRGVDETEEGTFFICAFLD